MSPFARKFLFLSLPLFLVAVLVNAAYTGGRWYLERDALAVPFTRELLDIWFPVAISLFAVWGLLWKRIKRLQFNGHETNKRVGLAAIAFVAIAGPMLLSQGPMEASFVRQLDTIETEELLENRSRYLKFEAALSDPTKSGWSSDVSPPERSSRKIRVEMYCVSPLLLTHQSGDNVSKVWIGKRFRGALDSTLPSEEIDREYRTFLDASWNKFMTLSMNRILAWRRVVYQEEREFYLDAVGMATRTIPSKDMIILEGLMKGEAPEFEPSDVKASAFALLGALLAFTFCLVPTGVRIGYRSESEPAKVRSDANPSLIRFFIPKKDNVVQAILLNSMILIFLLMVIDGVSLTRPTVPDLMEWGANRRPETTGGQWWRLLTSVFLHGGILHLALNCYGFLFGSSYVQWVYGQRKYATIFFVSGICASLASILWYENSASVGASGAIFGLFGAHTAMLMQKLLPDHVRKPMLSNMAFYLGINLVWGMQGGIDNAAHGGGYLSGFLLGWFYLLVSKRKIRRNMGLHERVPAED